MARLQQVYKEKVVPELLKEFAYKNVMQVPRVKKITLNMGVGEAVADKKQIENAVRDMTAIAGQKPVVTKARKSIAGFKIRDGWPIGCKVTLRGEHMWEFLDRLIAISIPRIRDFRGLNGKSFDGRGNYSMVCASRSCSLKSIMTKWMRSVDWTSPSPHRLTLMRKAKRS